MFSLSNNVIGKIAFASDFFPSIGGLLDVVTGLQWKLGRCFKNLDTFFEKVLEEHLDPARPKPQHEDITDVMLGLAKDRTTVIRLEKEHMKAVLLFTVANLLHCFDWKLPGGLKEEELNMEEEFGLNIRKKVPLKLVATKHNWEENK
ncbi:hypothetical protein Acr_15g0003670 [Actinidia rufa]|uniref:Uncharacterized protein n=1 Tax=Actinidia rufa TaxID=165716 RepID=A0A7J0FUZ6_9ERIC|nr:hypothetical protein Acr_15g0003670 [Actinidia rufa]